MQHPRSCTVNDTYNTMVFCVIDEISDVGIKSLALRGTKL